MKPLTVLWTCLALFGFAGNSLLCRLALRTGDIDASSFTTLRLVSGAVTLGLLARQPAATLLSAGSKLSALALFLYAAPFSYAYVALPAGTGALILFGAVQATMLSHAIFKGERPSLCTWFGLGLALSGLIALNAPGASAPSGKGALCMLVAGIAWGIYSLRGKRSQAKPLLATAANFVLAVPLTLAFSALTLPFLDVVLTSRGVLLAITSGALASGVGYSLWYAALPALRASQAAIIQLLVPVLAAVSGVVLLEEPVSMRLIACGGAIVLGVVLALPAPTKHQPT